MANEINRIVKKNVMCLYFANRLDKCEDCPCYDDCYSEKLTKSEDFLNKAEKWFDDFFKIKGRIID